MLYTITTSYHSISILATCYVGYPRTQFNLIQNLIRQFQTMLTCKFKILIRIHHLFLFIIPTKHTLAIVRSEERRGNQQVLVMHWVVTLPRFWKPFWKITIKQNDHSTKRVSLDIGVDYETEIFNLIIFSTPQKKHFTQKNYSFQVKLLKLKLTC